MEFKKKLFHQSIRKIYKIAGPVRKPPIHANKIFYQTYVLLLVSQLPQPPISRTPQLAPSHVRISNDCVDVLKARERRELRSGERMCGRSTLFYGWSVEHPGTQALRHSGTPVLVSDYASCGHKFILKDVRC